MEHPILNPDAQFEARLAEQLRAASAAPLPDNGFSVRVMDALPARSPAQRYLWIFPVVGAAIGLGLALANGASVAEVTSLWEQAQNFLNNSTALLLVAIAGGALMLLSSPGESSF